MPNQTKSKFSSNRILSKERRPLSATERAELSVIIVNYNVKEFLEQALVSLKRALTGILSEIIVVDNASSDGSATLIREKFPEAKTIENSKNLGFAKASNQGLCAATGQYLVLLNPDTIVQEDTFSRMLDFFRAHPDTGMLGCKILNPDGSLQLACRRSFPTPWVAFTRLSGLSYVFPKTKLFGKYNLTYLDPDTSSEVEAISGSLMMISRDVLQEVGYLDESFFLYGEDLDWCYRIRERGWKVRYFSGTQIIHFKGESSKRAEFDQLTVFYRAMSLFVKKHFKQKYIFMPYWFLWVAVWIRAGFSVLTKLIKAVSVPFTDLMLLCVCLTASVYLRFGSFSHLESFIPVIAAYALIWIFMLIYFGCYDGNKFSTAKAALAIVIGFLLNTSFTFFFKQYAFSRAVILFGGGLSLLSIPGWRLAAKMLPRLGIGPFKGTLGKTLLARNTVVVGEPESGQKLIKKLNSQVDSGYNVIGLVDINGLSTGRRHDGVEVLGSLKDLNSIIRDNKIKDVIFSTPQLSYDRILDLISRSGDYRVNFKLVPSNLDVIVGKASIDKIDDLPLLDIDYRLHRIHFRAMKRAFDLLLALTLSIVALPVFMFKKYLTGTELQKTKALGNHGSEMTLYHFGKLGTGWINQIPFLWSVLTGDLSIVGGEIKEIGERPEPLLDKETTLKPGITGLCQVHDHKQLSDDEKERYNIYYMKNYSPLLDLEIILKALLH